MAPQLQPIMLTSNIKPNPDGKHFDCTVRVSSKTACNVTITYAWAITLPGNMDPRVPWGSPEVHGTFELQPGVQRSFGFQVPSEALKVKAMCFLDGDEDSQVQAYTPRYYTKQAKPV